MKLLEGASFPGESPGAGAPTSRGGRGRAASPRGCRGCEQSGRFSNLSSHLQWVETRPRPKPQNARRWEGTAWALGSGVASVAGFEVRVKDDLSVQSAQMRWAWALCPHPKDPASSSPGPKTGQRGVYHATRSCHPSAVRVKPVGTRVDFVPRSTCLRLYKQNLFGQNDLAAQEN